MKTTTNKGFTLIELLVVIAIIGILASVVLASLNSARAKGSDAAVKSAMANLRAQAALYYDSNSQTYGAASTACTDGVFGSGTNNAGTIVTNIGTNANGSPTCDINDQTYAISAPLKGGGTWCVDSSGKAASTTISNHLCQ